MRHFEKLRTLRTFRKEHADIFSTLEGHHLISEIGFHQARGEPLTLKQLFLLDIGSVSTVQRRLRQLKERGLVRHQPSARDRRAVELTLSAKCLRIFARYDELMSSKPAGRGSAPGNAESRHVCGLCDSDAGRRNLLAGFFTQGLKRGDRCVLVAPTPIQKEILDGLPHRRRASEQLHVTEGHASGEAQLAFYRRLVREAKQAGQNLCVAGDASWALSRNFSVDELFDYEKRLDVLARKSALTVMCVYDARDFSGGDFLRAVKCHRDHARHPILLG
jgi:DNA-binding MarR family transcriptional regulator